YPYDLYNTLVFGSFLLNPNDPCESPVPQAYRVRFSSYSELGHNNSAPHWLVNGARWLVDGASRPPRATLRVSAVQSFRKVARRFAIRSRPGSISAATPAGRCPSPS